MLCALISSDHVAVGERRVEPVAVERRHPLELRRRARGRGVSNSEAPKPIVTVSASGAMSVPSAPESSGGSSGSPIGSVKPWVSSRGRGR